MVVNSQEEKWKRKPTVEEIEFARTNTAREVDRMIRQQVKVSLLFTRDLNSLQFLGLSLSEFLLCEQQIKPVEEPPKEKEKGKKKAEKEKAAKEKEKEKLEQAKKLKGKGKMKESS